MFNRWMIVLVVLFVLLIIPGDYVLEHLEAQIDPAQEKWTALAEDCNERVNDRPKNWTIESDTWYRLNCDRERRSSLYNVLNKHYNKELDKLLIFLIALWGLPGIALASLIGRWIYLGGKKKTKPTS